MSIHLHAVHPRRSRCRVKVSIEGPVTLPSRLSEFDYTHVSSVQLPSYGCPIICIFSWVWFYSSSSKHKWCSEACETRCGSAPIVLHYIWFIVAIELLCHINMWTLLTDVLSWACAIEWKFAAIRELGVQPYNEESHMGELRYVQASF